MINFTNCNLINRLLFFVSIFLTILSSGCATKFNQQTFNACEPENIGVILGHDVSAVSSLTTGEEILIGLSFGLVGVAIAEGTADEWRLKFETDINQMLMGKIQNVMQEKKYKIHFLESKPKKWKLFENITDKKNVYSNLASYYDIEGELSNFDALLFVEYLLEGRLEGRFWNSSNLENLTVDNMKLMYAKSKIFLYDPKTEKRIYHDMVQRGYSSFSSTTVSEALDTLLSLDLIPTANVQ